MPGGSASPFCTLARQTSSCHASTCTGIPPSDDTASTSTSESGDSSPRESRGAPKSDRERRTSVNRSYQVFQDGAQIGVVDEDIRIFLHAVANYHPAEADEEIDGRLRFEIAGAVADESGSSVRARAHVAHDELFSAGPREKRAAI